LLLNHLALKQKISLQTYFLSGYRSVRTKDILGVLKIFYAEMKKGFKDTANY